MTQYFQDLEEIPPKTITYHVHRNPFNGSNMLINISAGEVYNSTVNVHNTKDIRCLISGMKGLSVFDLPFNKKVTTEAIPTKSLSRRMK